MYDTEEVFDQKGIQDDCAGLGAEKKALFEAGSTYILPDLDKQITFSPLNLVRMRLGRNLIPTFVIFLPLSVGSGRKVCE